MFEEGPERVQSLSTDLHKQIPVTQALIRVTLMTRYGEKKRAKMCEDCLRLLILEVTLRKIPLHTLGLTEK